MKFLRYFILALIVWGLPTFFWSNYGEMVGNVFSTLLLGCLVIYYAVNQKKKPVVSFLVLGLLYYSISGMFYTGSESVFIKDAIKYFIFMICAYEVARRTSNIEFFVFLLISALSILVHAMFFPSSYGRYAGFTINPNGAGFICALTFSLVFTLKNRVVSLISQGLIVICGILTFSRTAILLLLLIYLLAIANNRKNLVGLIFGTLALIIVITSSGLRLNTVRLNAFKSVFSSHVDTKTLGEESRDETWALYSDFIVENMAFGGGFNSMQGGDAAKTTKLKVGVHNTFLMVIGEAGIIPFLMIIIIYLLIFIRSLKFYKEKPELVYMAISVITFLLITHNYFDNHIVLFASLWLYYYVSQPLEDKQPLEINQLNS